MKKVDTKVIYPSNYIGSWSDVILESFLNHIEMEIPKVGTNLLQNKKAGILVIGGNIKELDFNNSGVDIRANKTDCLAVWFLQDLSYPGENYNDDTNQLLLNSVYPSISDYFALPHMIQVLIMGIEQTLLRRVVAIGQSVKDIDKWISIPKIRIKKLESQEISTQENS